MATSTILTLPIPSTESADRRVPRKDLYRYRLFGKRLKVRMFGRTHTRRHYRLHTAGERFLMHVSGCSFRHDFGWPISDRPGAPVTMTYPAGFDSSQSCSKCGCERFYNSQTFTGGPTFRRLHMTPVIKNVK